MTVDAMVLEIQKTKTIYGLLDQNGKCGSGSCEGCKCSTGIKKISLPVDSLSEPKIGELVEIHNSGAGLLHFALIILLPLLVLVITQFIPALMNLSIRTDTLNLISLLSGALTFAITSLLVRALRKKDAVQVVRK